MHELRVEDDDAGRRVLLDAPARRNALTLDTVQRLHDVLGDDPEATLLLGSTTPGVFSSGADLDADDTTRAALSDLLYACYERVLRRPGIVVAVVEGAAVGGGAQLSTVADLRVISEQARWRWVGPGHGLSVGAWLLPDLVGRSRGLDLTLTSRWLEAPEAVACGLAPAIETDPWSRAYETAQRLARCDAGALARTKHAALPRLLGQLNEEREQNRSAWRGHAPSAREAAQESRDRRRS